MDILRFLASVPARVGRTLAALLRPVFGSVAWTPPPWGQRSAAYVRANAKAFRYGVLGTLGAAVLAVAGWQIWIHLPHPPEPARRSNSSARR